MKAKLIIGFIVVAVAALVGWNIEKNQDKVVLSDLALANVEALAQDEGELDSPRSWYVYKDWEGNFGNVGIVTKCAKGGDQFCI